MRCPPSERGVALKGPGGVLRVALTQQLLESQNVGACEVSGKTLELRLAWREAVEGSGRAVHWLDRAGELHSCQREDRCVVRQFQLVAVSA